MHFKPLQVKLLADCKEKYDADFVVATQHAASRSPEKSTVRLLDYAVCGMCDDRGIHNWNPYIMDLCRNITPVPVCPY